MPRTRKRPRAADRLVRQQNENAMPQTTVRKRDELIARTGLVLAFFVFLIASISAFQSGVKPVVTVVVGFIAVFCLWAAVFASQRIAILVGRWLP